MSRTINSSKFTAALMNESLCREERKASTDMFSAPVFNVTGLLLKVV